MTDTDSLFYEIKTDDVYKDLFGENSKCKNCFDTSNFNKANPYYSDKNKMVSGKLKCENADNMIGKFVGLKSKNYAFTYENELLNEKEKQKLIRCKGTTKATIKNEIHFDSLVNTLKEGTITKNDNYTIRSKNHKVSLCKINKISLSCYDDKRYILEDGITS